MRVHRALNGRMGSRRGAWLCGAGYRSALGVGLLVLGGWLGGVPEASAFSYRKSITVNAAQVTGGPLTNFPMLVNIASDNGLRTTTNGGNVTSANGYDIIFRALDDTTCGGAGTAPCTLSHEIESYTATTGQIIAWVNVPSINNGTVIYVYYGDAAVTASTQDPTGVWDTTYRLVSHMADNPDTSHVKDSTSNANNGTKAGAGRPAVTTSGEVAYAQTFNGTTDYINMGSAASIDSVFAGGATAEAWIYPNSFGENNGGRIADKANTVTYGADQGWAFLIYNGGTYGNSNLSFAHDFTASNPSLWHTNNNTISTGSWQHVVVTYNNSSTSNNPSLYINGVSQTVIEVTAPAGTAETDAAYNLRIGNLASATTRTFDGIIDEFRISKTIRTAGWITTEYNNQKPSSTFYALGAQQGPNAPTLVRMRGMSASASGDGTVAVQWRTGYEVDNLGFHVYREQGGHRERVTPSLVAGSALFAGSVPLTAGRSYTWVDRSRVAGVSYWLEEWDLSGARRWHGPIRVQAGQRRVAAQASAVAPLNVSGEATSVLLSALGRPAVPSPTRAVQRQVLQASSSADERRAVQWRLAGGPAVKILVSEAGWYRVSQEDLVSAGLDPGADPGALHLFTDGQEVAILVDGKGEGRFDPGDAIEFYGLGLDTPSSGVRIYWLAVVSGTGARIREGSGAGRWSPGPASFPCEVERRDRTVYDPAVLNGGEDKFFGDVVTTTMVTETVRVQHPDRSGEALLTVRLQGATRGAHRVWVEFDGMPLGRVVWDGMEAGELVVPLAGNVVFEGDHALNLTAEGGDGDVSLVDFVRLRYAHTWEPDREALEFSLDGYQEVVLRGFASSRVRVLDVTDPTAVEGLSANVVERDGTYDVTVGVPGSGTRALLAVGTGAFRHPVGVLPNRPAAWHAADSGADLVIIGHRSLLPAVEPLRALRERQGLKVAVVDVENVYDEFSFGAKTPQAMRDFLAWARGNWSRPPRYVLLVGDASFDPRNRLGYGWSDLVPTKLVETTYLETASDEWFVDPNGDGIGDIPVGRLPVQDAVEAATVIGKIVAYESDGGSAKVLLVADANDEGNDFEGLSRLVGAALPASVTVAVVNRGALGETASGELGTQLYGRQTMVNYIGHGSVGWWRDLFSTDDAHALQNRWPAFWASMTCLNGYFQDPGDESMAEALLRSPGGAAAVWASSGLTESKDQISVDDALVGVLFPASGSAPTLGDATLLAKAATTDKDIRRTWILFGDPTMKLR